MSALPNLFVVGAAKSGTTALYQYCKRHPGIFVPESIKELSYMAFFAGLPALNGPGDRHNATARSVTSMAEYLRLYDDRHARKIRADISPAYLYYPQASGKIAELCPEAKIVIILRNPIESAFSMFAMMRREGREPCRSFRDAFQLSEARMATGWVWAWDYKRTFLYSEHVIRYLQLFPGRQLFIRRYEELKKNPKTFFDDLTNFMGVLPIDHLEANNHVNCAPRWLDMLRQTDRGRTFLSLARTLSRITPPGITETFRRRLLEQPAYVLSRKDRRLLLDHFRRDIMDLAKLLSWDLDEWLSI